MRNKALITLAGLFLLSTSVPTLASSVGWQQQGSEWHYLKQDGSKATGWLTSGNNWFYFNEKGVMQTGWQKVGNHWFYFDHNGYMQRGWNKINGSWFYFNYDGYMQTGWVWYNGHWYLMDQNGYMQTGWANHNGTWYYMNGDGAMQTGWLASGNDWYYLNPNGDMRTGWMWEGGSWYYMMPNVGNAAKLLHQIDGKLYYFGPNNKMATKTTVVQGQIVTPDSNGAIRNNGQLWPLEWAAPSARVARFEKPGQGYIKESEKWRMTNDEVRYMNARIDNEEVNKRFMELVNTERAHAGLGRVTYDYNLQQTAEFRSFEEWDGWKTISRYRNGRKYRHRRTDTWDNWASYLNDKLRPFGYSSPWKEGVGENGGIVMIDPVGTGGDRQFYMTDPKQIAEAAYSMWFNSPGHHAAMMSWDTNTYGYGGMAVQLVNGYSVNESHYDTITMFINYHFWYKDLLISQPGPNTPDE